MSKSIDNNIINIAKGCLNCNNARCRAHCPLSNDIPNFMRAVAEGNGEFAYDILSVTSCVGSICGGICPYQYCRGHCVKGQDSVDIGKVEQYISTHYATVNTGGTRLRGKHISIVGGGIAGITVAIDLARQGGQVTIIDKNSCLGGVARYGIPNFRLAEEHVDSLVQLVDSYGIMVQCNVTVGRDITISDISKASDAVVIAVGWGRDNVLEASGDMLGVVTSSSYLANPTPADRVVVIGGGNVAVDCSRVAIRLGADTTIAYRRTVELMPAFCQEVELCRNEGVKIIELVSPSKILGDTAVSGIELLDMCLSTIGDDGRATVIQGSTTTTLPCSQVIVATGSYLDDGVLFGSNIAHDQYHILVDSNGQTNVDNIYACGDITNDINTAVYGVRDALVVANSIINKIGE